MGVMRPVPTPEPDTSLEARLAAYLRGRPRSARRGRGEEVSERSRHSLRLASKGRLELDEERLTQVAAAVVDDLSSVASPRAPLTLVTEGLAIGGHRETFRRGQPRAAMYTYLDLLDAVARGAMDPTPILRTDIELLQGLLQADPVVLIHRIGHHFDLERETREAMVRLHRQGTPTIGFRWPRDRVRTAPADQLNWPTQPGAPGAPRPGGPSATAADEAPTRVPAHWWDERATATSGRTTG